MTQPRDIHLPASHWKEYLARVQRKLEDYDTVLEQPNCAADVRLQFTIVVSLRRRELLVAQYSAGLPVTIVQATFRQVLTDCARYVAVVHKLPNLREFDAYVEVLWLVAWALLFDISDVEFDNLLAIIETNHRDRLLDCLIALRRSDWPISEKLLHSRPYKHLLQAIESEDTAREGYIARFLAQYYVGMKQAYWHDLHVIQPGNFFGYWCFELAAIVKALAISDTSFANNEFYPRDLATFTS